MTKVQTCTPTRVSFFTCGNPVNTGSYIVKGTAIPGRQYFIEYLGEVPDDNLVTGDKYCSNEPPPRVVRVEPQEDDTPGDPEDAANSRGPAVRVMITTHQDKKPAADDKEEDKIKRYQEIYHADKPTAKDRLPAQIEDGKIRITAYVEPAIEGLTVYFEVLDPDDPSNYLEDSDPTTSTIEKDLVDDKKPDDNRDPAQTMYTAPGGDKAEQYQKFQSPPFLSAREAKTEIVKMEDGNVAVAEVTLTITKRYSGDNYIVRATLLEPKKDEKERYHPFDESFTEEQIASEVKSSGLLTAWKRYYVEHDRMFQVGTDLTGDAGASQAVKNEIPVKTTDPDGSPIFAAGDTIQIFDTDDKGARWDKAGETAVIARVEPRKLILSPKPDGSFLSGDYTVAKSGHVGKLKDADDDKYDAFFDVRRSLPKETDDTLGKVRNLLKFTYIECVVFEDVSGLFPHQFKIALKEYFGLSDRWWSVELQNSDLVDQRKNFIHPISVDLSTEKRLGDSENVGRYTYIFLGNITDLVEESIAAVHRATLHEFTHHLDDDPKPQETDVEYHHDGNIIAIVPPNSPFCIMKASVKPKTTPLIFGWCKYHVYASRDQVELEFNGPGPK